jgi:hypothetical protein
MPGPPNPIDRGELQHALITAMRKLSDTQAEQAASPRYVGLAKVFRRASQYPASFAGFRTHHVHQVTDIPVGLTVFCLPMLETDCGWKAVIITVEQEARMRSRLTWVHPQCLRALPQLGTRPQVGVQHTEKRGRREPSIDIGPRQVGVRALNGELVLDARWDFTQGREDSECTGHCYALCKSLVTHDIAFAIVMQFAENIRSHKVGHVCCHRGKHRSVAAANVLDICFSLAVNMDNAATERCHQCCKCRVMDHASALMRALRELPVLAYAPDRSLARALKLSE